MKLKQADKSTTGYPSKYSFKPLLLGVGVAIALSGCANNQPKTNETKSSVIKKSTNIKVTPKEDNKKTEVKIPPAVAGVPPLPDSMKNSK